MMLPRELQTGGFAHHDPFAPRGQNMLVQHIAEDLFWEVVQAFHLSLKSLRCFSEWVFNVFRKRLAQSTGGSKAKWWWRPWRLRIQIASTHFIFLQHESTSSNTTSLIRRKKTMTCQHYFFPKRPASHSASAPEMFPTKPWPPRNAAKAHRDERSWRRRSEGLDGHSSPLDVFESSAIGVGTNIQRQKHQKKAGKIHISWEEHGKNYWVVDILTIQPSQLQSKYTIV